MRVVASSHGRQLAFRVLVPLVTTTIVLVLAEVGFRAYSRWTYDAEFPPWTENLVPLPAPQVFTFKSHATGVFPGNADQTRTFPYRTNAHGLRDRDRPARAPGAKRTLLMGDSYAWGYAVAEEEAFPQVTERLLRDGGRVDAEVVNAGIPDYNSRQERQLLEQLLPIYTPDAVFLAYVVNDAELPTAMPVPPEEVYRHTRSWFLTEVVERLNHKVFRRRLLPSKKDQFGETYLDGFAADSPKWRDSRDAIRQMRDLARARKIPFAVLVLPDFTLSFDDRYRWRPIHEAVVSWGKELEIPVFDLLSTFRGQDHQTLWVPWDGHPNAEAHRQIAMFLAARIAELR
jgi:lysophospholipase L1-like esterase